MEVGQPAVVSRELALADRHTGVRRWSRQCGSLARRNSNGQTLGDFAGTTLVRAPGIVFVAYGTLDLAGIGSRPWKRRLSLS